jgi:hypothetical protein
VLPPFRPDVNHAAPSIVQAILPVVPVLIVDVQVEPAVVVLYVIDPGEQLIEKVGVALLTT